MAGQGGGGPSASGMPNQLSGNTVGAAPAMGGAPQGFSNPNLRSLQGPALNVQQLYQNMGPFLQQLYARNQPAQPGPGGQPAGGTPGPGFGAQTPGVAPPMANDVYMHQPRQPNYSPAGGGNLQTGLQPGQMPLNPAAQLQGGMVQKPGSMGATPPQQGGPSFGVQQPGVMPAGQNPWGLMQPGQRPMQGGPQPTPQLGLWDLLQGANKGPGAFGGGSLPGTPAMHSYAF